MCCRVSSVYERKASSVKNRVFLKFLKTTTQPSCIIVLHCQAVLIVIHFYSHANYPPSPPLSAWRAGEVSHYLSCKGRITWWGGSVRYGPRSKNVAWKITYHILIFPWANTSGSSLGKPRQKKAEGCCPDVCIALCYGARRGHTHVQNSPLCVRPFFPYILCIRLPLPLLLCVILCLGQDFRKPFDSPAVLVVGHQTSGKSALIEALMGFQFNQVTRRLSVVFSFPCFLLASL